MAQQQGSRADQWGCGRPFFHVRERIASHRIGIPPDPVQIRARVVLGFPINVYGCMHGVFTPCFHVLLE